MNDPTYQKVNGHAGRADLGRYCAKYESALRTALPDVTLPTVEEFLADTAGEERAILQAELEQVRRRVLAEATADHATAPDDAHAPTATGEYAPDPDATGEYVSTGDGRARTAAGRVPQVPGYEVLRVLGRGGMGVVYLARHVRLNRLVALKMVLAGDHASPTQLDRFHDESLAVARLQHPNIVQIFEVGEHDGLPFFSLEYVPGGSLLGKIRHDPQPPAEAARTVETLARAVQSAHADGVIHRDLKPANVLLAADGTPKVTDFGLAKAVADDSSRTESGSVLGTPSYMAPEQARGAVHDLGPHTDVYALGAILYHMLTGRPPFQGASTLDTLEQVRSREPVPPGQLLKVPRDLETVCLKCLQKEPRKRYESAEALADDLRRFLDGRPVLARPVSAPERAWRWCRRNKAVAALTAGVVLSLLTAVVVLAVSLVAVADARDVAQKKETYASEQKVIADVARDVAQKKEKVAKEQSQVAVRTMYDVVNTFQLRLKAIPELRDLRLALLGEAEKGLESVYRDADESVYDRTTAGVFQRRGDLALEMNQPEKARELYGKSHAITGRMEAESPQDPILKRNHAVVTSKLAEVALRLGDADGAEKRHREALALRLAWAGLDPAGDEPRRMVARSYGDLGRIALESGRSAEARDHYRNSETWQLKLSPKAQEVVETRRERAGLYARLGDVSFKLDDGPAAREYVGRALAIRRPLADKEKPPQVVLRLDLALSHLQAGDVSLLLLNDPAAARESYEAGLKLRQLVLKSPREADEGAALLAEAHYRLATACRRCGRSADAEAHYQECLKLRRKLAAGHKANTAARVDLLLALARCGQAAEAGPQADELRKTLDSNRYLLYHLACVYAQCGAAEGPDAGRYRDAAVAALRRVSALGWRGYVELRTDPDLDPIRTHPEYAPMEAELKAAWEKSRTPATS
jgi:serine/threonine-protein kinase